MSALRWLTPILLSLAALLCGGEALARQDAPTAIPAERKAERVAILPISGPIDQVSLWSLERRLAAANEQGFDAVVLEIDTPGGDVAAMLDILLRLKSDAPLNTVAWIHPKAFSAGTFIALGCREIVVAPGSVFGDAAPIAAVPGMGIVPLPAAERAKQESPLLDELDAAAARRGDDPRLLHAFVAVERELWLIERIDDGAKRFADRAELEALGLDPKATAARPPTAPAAPSRPLSATDRPLTPDDAGAWRVVETIDTADRLLVVQSDEALRWGLATAEIRDEKGILAHFAADSLQRFPESWTEGVVRLLVSWPMRILLIAIFIVALVIESLHPGVGVAGAIAGVALLLLVGAPSLLGLAQWWEVLLVLVGIALVGVEILVLPGTGFVGVAGGACILLGLIASFTGTDPTSAGQRSVLLTAASTTIAGITLGAIGVWFASRWFGESKVLRRAVLSASVANAEEPPPRSDPRMPAAGTLGVADSDLRPSGRARFGRDILDAQSDGDYIPRGTAIVATGRAGATVLVARADGPSTERKG